MNLFSSSDILLQVSVRKPASGSGSTRIPRRLENVPTLGPPAALLWGDAELQRVECSPMTGSILLMVDDAMSRGIPIAIAGILIVFTALLLISLFIASLPRVLAMVAKVLPEVDESHARQSLSEDQAGGDGAVLAAIGFVLHTELQNQLAAEKDATGKG
jgi:hypothetical protein